MTIELDFQIDGKNSLIYHISEGITDAPQDIFSIQEFYNFLAEEFDKAHYHLERNANAKILFLDLSITIANTIN